MIAAAIVVIYIVLGMLYESLVHPITVLSTLPVGRGGAVLACCCSGWTCRSCADRLFLLIGVVKKKPS